MDQRPTDAVSAPDVATGSTLEQLLDEISPPQTVQIRLLLPADSPRQEGEDVEHARMLSMMEADLPPIIVHRSTMRVIDGMHRLGGAQSRGDTHILVQFFNGTEEEAFVLAVRANIAHGLPLSLADRTRAAERIIASHPMWSDRVIAAAAGLGASTVGGIRRRVKDAGDEMGARMGRDGRMRPLDHAEGRRRASEIIRSRPDASLREIAKSAGVSPSTARDVRKRIQRGMDPVPEVRPPEPRRESPAGPDPEDRSPHGETDVASILRGLQNDPSLRFTESGRSLLRWVLSRAVRADEWQEFSGQVPPHCAYTIADVARSCAEEWLRIAADLDARSGHRSVTADDPARR